MRTFWTSLALAGAFFSAIMLGTVIARSQPVYVSGCSGTSLGNGYVLTAGHCVEGQNETQLKRDSLDTDYWTAKVVFTDHRRDFALLKVDDHFTVDADGKATKDVTPFDVTATKVGCEYPKMGQHYKIKGWPAMVGYTEVIGYIAGPQKKRGPWDVSYVMVAPIFYGNSGSGGYNQITDQVEIVVVGMMPGTSLALVIPTAEICNILPR